MSRTIECADCGASVAYGRLSCPECGALLAAVAGSPTPRVQPSSPSEAVAPDDLPPPDLSPAPAAPEAPARSEPVIAARAGPGPTVAGPRFGPMAGGVARTAGLVTAPAVGGAVPAWPADRAIATSEGLRTSASTGDSADPLPGSVATPFGIADPDRIAEIAGWVIVVGAVMSALGLLLPWSRVVIGAGSFGGYFSNWGLASPTHLLVFVATLGLLAVAVVPSPRIPGWLTLGVGGLLLGGLLLGLTWPYVVGPLGAQIGVLIVALGAVALVAGGTLTVWSARHPENEPRV